MGNSNFNNPFNRNTYTGDILAPGMYSTYDIRSTIFATVAENLQKEIETKDKLEDSLLYDLSFNDSMDEEMCVTVTTDTVQIFTIALNNEKMKELVADAYGLNMGPTDFIRSLWLASIHKFNSKYSAKLEKIRSLSLDIALGLLSEDRKTEFKVEQELINTTIIKTIPDDDENSFLDSCKDSSNIVSGMHGIRPTLPLWSFFLDIVSIMYLELDSNVKDNYSLNNKELFSRDIAFNTVSDTLTDTFYYIYRQYFRKGGKFYKNQAEKLFLLSHLITVIIISRSGEIISLLDLQSKDDKEKSKEA